jgi:hypothetical protein
MKVIDTRYRSKAEVFEAKIGHTNICLWRRDWNTQAGILEFTLDELQDLMVFLSELGGEAAQNL